MKRRTFLQGAAAAVTTTAWARAQAPDSSGTAWKAAVIGHTGRGNYGHGLDVIFNDRPGIEVVAVADPDAAGRVAAQKRSRAGRAYEDYREMLEKERPHLVSVAPRWTDQHHAMVSAALAVGAHVYCEKPFTRTLAEADDLLAKTQGSGRMIAVAHQGRVAPSTLELKRQLESGLIGELLEIRAWGKQDRRAGGEDLLVLGTHQFDLVRFFAGDPLWCTARILQNGREVTRADARAATEDIGPVVGDEIDATFALPGGVILSFSSRAKNAAATGPWGYEMIGTKGRVKVLNDVYPLTFVLEREARAGTGETLVWRSLSPDAAAKVTAAERGTGPANRRVVDDWLASIAGKREPLCSGFAAMKSLEMIHAVFAAGISRGRVQLPLQDRIHPLAG